MQINLPFTFKNVLRSVNVLSLATATFLLALPTLVSAQDASDWLQWRGPTSNNHATSNWDIPAAWDLETNQNVLWKTPIPGRGHSTPIFVGDYIFLTTMDTANGVQVVLRFDRETGKKLNQWAVHRGGLPLQMHANNSGASSSLASDGKNIYASFHNNDSIIVTALTLDGQLVWQKTVCEYKPRAFQFGYGPSPIIEGDLLIVAAECDGPTSGIYALDLSTGNQVWKAARDPELNWATPIVATIAGERSILSSGNHEVTSYDIKTGAKLWSVDAGSQYICGTIVWDGRHVLIGGGTPESGTWCIDGTGDRKVLWENGVKCYEQSLLAIDGYVFAVSDSGVAYCWRTIDGQEMWKERVCGVGVSASPLLVGNKIVLASEDGDVVTLAANPDRFEILSDIKTGDSLFASPVAVNNRLYIRTGVQGAGGRQEYLVALSAGR